MLLMEQWLAKVLPTLGYSANPRIASASEDASFRSYYRLKSDSGTLIVMDAPPSHEDCEPFIKVQKLLKTADIPVPDVLAYDLEQGFLLLSDLGNTLFLDILNSDNVNKWYGLATQHIHQMQSIDAEHLLPTYDQLLLQQEINLFRDWFIIQHLGYELDQEELQILKNVEEMLVKNAQQQPQAMVHRDFHSRNLMCHQNNAAVIDFQDAVWGPITYDLVSLYKDCYIAWPEDQVNQWVDTFRQQFNEQHKTDYDQSIFLRWFDLMGIQRHMKAIGIFCRLNYRDNKKQYLYDIPRTMKYVMMTCLHYPELKTFHQLLQHLQPKLQLA